jgi:hypothetical protein
MPVYFLHDPTGADLGILDHPVPNLEPGDVVFLQSGEEAVVTTRTDAEAGQGVLVATLEVTLSPRGSGRWVPSPLA